MLPTPSTSHVSFDNIYEPAEDSYLLLDTLSSTSETTFLTNHFPSTSKPPLVLEVGVGSGVVLAFVAANAKTIFGRTGVAFLGTDVNPLAAKAATQTVVNAVSEAKQSPQSPVFLSVPVCDLVSAVRPGVVDVLIFNPPYVPTESLPLPADIDSQEIQGSHAKFERDSKLLELSYAGGHDGMETTNRLIDSLPLALSNRGVAYILLCAQNKPDDVKAGIRLLPGDWQAETVGSSGNKAGWEKLVIIRIWRSQEPQAS
jgi:release factor glutamine methyltransferase